MIDYHLHTARCCHATGTVEEYLAEAEIRGLKEIGFADHFPLGLLGYTPRSQVTMHPEELEDYISDIHSLRNKSKFLTVKLGIEVDFLPGTEDKLSALLEQYAFDYVIGSIHFMEDWDFTHPVYAQSYKERDIDKLYGEYFELVEDLCCSGLFDIIGHIDVIKKFGYRPSGNLDALWREIACLLNETDVCLELNTAGRDAPIGGFYPDRRLLEICCQEGVAVTLGSDAHAPQQVGRYFAEAVDMLKNAGYKELTSFNGRVRENIPLP